MNFLQDRKIKQKKKYTLTFIVVVIFLFFLAKFGAPDFTKKLFSNTFGRLPIFTSQVGEVMENGSERLLSKKHILSENEKLRGQIDAISIDLVDYEVLKNENNRLREIIGTFSNISDYSVAKVVSRPPVSLYDTLLVDLGESDGIVSGQKVYFLNRIFLGEVMEVYKDTSLVKLISNPEDETKGILIPSNTEITLVGRGGGSFEANIPRDLVVSPGTVVISSDRENHIIAIALNNISDPRDPVNTVLFRSPVNFNNIDFVAIK